MVNKDFGWIGTVDGTKKVPIEVDFPDKVDKSVIIGLCLIEAGMIVLHPQSIARYIIGSALIDAGVLLSLHETFYRGANQFCEGEDRALSELGLNG